MKAAKSIVDWARELNNLQSLLAEPPLTHVVRWCIEQDQDDPRAVVHLPTDAFYRYVARLYDVFRWAPASLAATDHEQATHEAVTRHLDQVAGSAWRELVAEQSFGKQPRWQPRHASVRLEFRCR